VKLDGTTHRIAALVPMRHDSERVIGKNYRLLSGRPLFHHILETLLECDLIDEVVVDTDSATIREGCTSHFPTVTLIDRPAELRGGNVPMNDILIHDCSLVEADLFLQTHSTNPLLRAETITKALEHFLLAGNAYDSMFTVTPIQTRLWTVDGKPINHDPAVLLRTQDLPPIMEENSCLYLFDADILRTRGSRIGERPLLYPLDPLEAWDIDDEADWAVVESLHRRCASGSDL